jgi:hypothetical protein
VGGAIAILAIPILAMIGLCALAIWNSELFWKIMLVLIFFAFLPWSLIVLLFRNRSPRYY